MPISSIQLIPRIWLLFFINKMLQFFLHSVHFVNIFYCIWPAIHSIQVRYCVRTRTRMSQWEKKDEMRDVSFPQFQSKCFIHLDSKWAKNLQRVLLFLSFFLYFFFFIFCHCVCLRLRALTYFVNFGQEEKNSNGWINK